MAFRLVRILIWTTILLLSIIQLHFFYKFNERPKPFIWVPSYPGSGSELFREFIGALTGTLGDNIYDESHCERAITCKTHYPVLPFQPPQDHRHSIILLLRNPAKAIPSFYNFKYEDGIPNRTSTHHSQAPEEYWRRARDKYMEREVDRYQQFVLFWANYQHVDMYLQYEKLFNATTQYEVARVLNRSGFDTTDATTAFQSATRDFRERRKSYTPKYRAEHKEMLLKMMDGLLMQALDDRLSSILREYRSHIDESLPIESSI